MKTIISIMFAACMAAITFSCTKEINENVLSTDKGTISVSVAGLMGEYTPETKSELVNTVRLRGKAVKPYMCMMRQAVSAHLPQRLTEPTTDMLSSPEQSLLLLQEVHCSLSTARSLTPNLKYPKASCQSLLPDRAHTRPLSWYMPLWTTARRLSRI